MKSAAVIGTGLIGQGWAIRFVLAGLDVCLFDADPQKAATSLTSISDTLDAMQSAGLCDQPKRAFERLRVATSLAECVEGADYVQESVLERADVKRNVCAQIDAALPSGALVGSSSSGIPASAFTEHLKHRARFFVVHPVNPPHLVPVVEIAPAPWSGAEHIPALRTLLSSLGMEPVLVRKEINGFILNRLQGALLNEAWALYEEGYASADDIDATVKHGLGRRWAFMGPFETIALNAPDGIVDYAQRLGGLYQDIAKSRSDPKPWSEQTAQRLDEDLADGDDRESKIKRRDTMLMALSKALS